MNNPPVTIQPPVIAAEDLVVNIVPPEENIDQGTPSPVPNSNQQREEEPLPSSNDVIPPNQGMLEINGFEFG